MDAIAKLGSNLQQNKIVYVLLSLVLIDSYGAYAVYSSEQQKPTLTQMNDLKK